MFKSSSSVAIAVSTILILLSSAAASQTILQLDHVSVCTSDVEDLTAGLSSLGFAPGAISPNGNATETATMGFGNQTSIEIIGPDHSGTIEGADWFKLIMGNAGPCFWAVVTTHLDDDVEQLKKAGIPTAPPEHGSRKRPDGMNVEWTSVQLGSGRVGSVFPVMVEDRTPRAWRVPVSDSAKDAPVSGVENVVLAVTNLDAAVALFRKAYGWSQPITETQRDFGTLAYFPGEPIILAAPSGGWMSEHVGKFGEGPVAILLGTHDFTAASKKFRLAGTKSWFGQKVGWFDQSKLKGLRLGVIGQ